SPDSSKTKVLFRNSSLLSSPNKKDRTPNVHFDVLPNHVEYYIYQEDTNYGNDIYLGIFDVSPDELSLVLTNHNALTVATIPVVAAGKISLGMDMLQTDEGIYICGFASVKDKDPVFNVLGIKIDVAESVLVRVIALKDWYEARLAE
ncbi:MAG: hypothetical protein KBS81_07360, partial [Spirochaetales bacterium]|nr:hypothetical protein [Candidatus Physcosoma equi]